MARDTKGSDKRQGGQPMTTEYPWQLHGDSYVLPDGSAYLVKYGAAWFLVVCDERGYEREIRLGKQASFDKANRALDIELRRKR
jgi:hypothetical protein